MSGRWPVLLLARELGIGGTERQLAVTASSLDRSEFEPHVGCFREGFRCEELRAAGVPVVRIPVTSFKSPSALTGGRVMGEYIRKHGIQLVHTFDTPLNVFGVPVAKAYRTPVILSSQRAHRELSGRFRSLLRISDRMVDGVVVNCESVKRQLIDEEKLPPERIQVCYNGIDTDVFHPHDRQTHDGVLTVGVVCALRPEKGLRTLVEAFAAVSQSNPLIRLQFVGSGPMLGDLQKLAADCGVAEVTSFEPTTSKVAEWLRRIDIFVLPSLSEALSNALMEAMACGCTVIASNVGGNPELVADDRTGMLFESGNTESLAGKLAAVIRDPALRQRLATSGMRMIRENFSVAESARQMQEVYRSYLLRLVPAAAR